MSDLLSAQLLREMNDEISDDEDSPISIGEIEVRFEIVPGLRQGPNLVWAFEEEHLYYCKCHKPGCRARLYIRTDGTAYRHSGIKHSANHGSMYPDFKYMYCFNAMKQKAVEALASTTSFQIYSEVVLE